MPPYVFYREEPGSETLLWRSGDLDFLLERRDESRNGGPRNAKFRVWDEDDAERGDAEWCENCSAHGAFGVDGYCDLCVQDMEQSEAGR